MKIQRRTKLIIYVIIFPILLYLCYFLYISTVTPNLPEPTFAKKEIKLFSSVNKTTINNNISYKKFYNELNKENTINKNAKYFIGINCSSKYKIYYGMLLAMIGYALGVEKYNVSRFQFFCFYGHSRLPTIDPNNISNHTVVLLKLMLRNKFYVIKNDTKVYKCNINITKRNNIINIVISSDKNTTAYKSCIAKFTIFFVEKFLPSIG